MRKKKIRICLVIMMLSFIVTGWTFLIHQSELNSPVSCGQGNLIRLHVLANSDNSEDQRVKLVVRDAIIAYLSPYLENVSDVTKAREIIGEHQNELVDIAKQVVANQGMDYSATLQVGIYDFPIKSYGNIILPAGKYEAVRILLGEAAGKNWWCVLFPPLCFIDATNAVAVPITTITTPESEQQKNNIEIRWKIAELWQN